MAYSNNKNNKKITKRLVIIPIGTLLLIVLAGFFVVNSNESKSETDIPEIIYEDGINLSPPTKEEVAQNDQTKIDRIENTNTASVPIDESVVIRDAYYDDGNDQIVVQTELYGTNWVSCTVYVEKEDTLITQTSETIYQQPYSSCKGFAFSDPKLTAGAWTVTLEANTLDNNKELSTVKIINIE